MTDSHLDLYKHHKKEFAGDFQFVVVPGGVVS